MKQIPDWPEYSIDEFGNVFRLKASCGTKPMKKLKWNLMHNGYAKVSLCRNSVRKEYTIHRLMAVTYIGDPTGKDVCHYDGNKLNNSLKNLRIDDRKGNMADQIRMGKTPRGEKCGTSKYDSEFIKQIKILLAEKVPVSKISFDKKVPVSTIYAIRQGRLWGWL